MATTPFDISDLNTVLGAYFREHTATIIQERLYRPGAFAPDRPSLWDLVDRTAIWDEKAWGEADFDINVQDADNAYNSQGNVVTIRGRTAKVSNMRSDFPIEWRKAYGSWLNHVAKQSYQDTRNMASLSAALDAFAEFLFNGVIDKFFEKFWLQTSMQGVKVAGFSNAQSFPSAADGWIKVLKDAITATQIPANQVVAVGGASVDNTNAYAHFENIGKAGPEKLDGLDLFLFSSVGNTDDYNAGFKAGNPGANQNIHDAYQRVRLEDRPNVAIIPTREMGTVDTTFMTTKDNLIFGTNFDSAPPQIFTSVGDDPLVINCSLLYSAAFAVNRYDEVVINDL